MQMLFIHTSNTIYLRLEQYIYLSSKFYNKLNDFFFKELFWHGLLRHHLQRSYLDVNMTLLM